MPNRFRADFSSTALRLIDSAGRDMTYLKKGAGTTYDPATLSVVQQPDVPYSVRGYQTRLSQSELREPNLVETTDMVVLLPGKGLEFTPEEEDKLTVGSDTFNITRIRSHHYKDEVPVWRLFCTKG